MGFRDVFINVARQIFFDNSTNGFVSDDVQGAIEEINTEIGEVSTTASPGFGFGRSLNVKKNSWLMRTGNVPSNKTGVTIGIQAPVLIKIDVGNEDINTFDIAIYEHEGDEINLTLLTTVSIVSKRTDSFTPSDFGTVTATQGRQIAVKLTTGSSRNIGVDITFKGQE